MGSIRKVTSLYIPCMPKRGPYKLYTRKIQEGYKEYTRSEQQPRNKNSEQKANGYNTLVIKLCE